MHKSKHRRICVCHYILMFLNFNFVINFQEQTASLLASLSRVPRCVLPLSSQRSVAAALVCFARAAPAHAPRQAELRAQARLHCHAAEAISRYASNYIDGIVINPYKIFKQNSRVTRK